MTKRDWQVLTVGALTSLGTYLLISIVYKLTHPMARNSWRLAFWGGLCVGFAVAIFYKPIFKNPTINLIVVLVSIGAGVALFTYDLVK